MYCSLVKYTVGSKKNPKANFRIQSYKEIKRFDMAKMDCLKGHPIINYSKSGVVLCIALSVCDSKPVSKKI